MFILYRLPGKGDLEHPVYQAWLWLNTYQTSQNVHNNPRIIEIPVVDIEVVLLFRKCLSTNTATGTQTHSCSHFGKLIKVYILICWMKYSYIISSWLGYISGSSKIRGSPIYICIYMYLYLKIILIRTKLNSWITTVRINLREMIYRVV